MNNNFEKRVLIKYNKRNTKNIELEKIIIFAQLNYLKNNRILRLYKNQRDIANKIVCSFKDRKIINIMVLSKTQSGKTGSMCATIEKFLESNEISTKNIYIISGLSSCSWKAQITERMPECLEKNICHRDDLLGEFVDRIKDKKNILIIMDEVQIASQKGQTIYKTFEKAGLLDEQKLYRNDIKILEYTATPDGTIYDLMKWKEASCKILSDAGDGYVSSYDLLKYGRFVQGEKVLILNKKVGKITKLNNDYTYNVKFFVNKKLRVEKFEKEDLSLYKTCDLRQNYLELGIRVKQYKELCGYNKLEKEIDKNVFDNIREVKQDVDFFDSPRYHIIRTRNGENQNITIKNFKKIFFPHKNYNFETFDENSKISDINKILIKKPLKHTFIFIKEMLRCSKTLNKEYLGILYERYSSNPDDTTIIQGLIGRDTGYDNNGDSICYTNIESIIKYEKLWNSGFENEKINWNSKTTTYKDSCLSGSDTFNDPKNYIGFLNKSSSTSSNNSSTFSTKIEPIINKFKSQEEVKDYFTKNLKIKIGGRGPNKRVENNKGFYECTLRTKIGVYSCEQIKTERRHGLTSDNYRLYPCYRNINDKNTLEWWLIHY
jgi:hypothetical protein